MAGGLTAEDGIPPKKRALFNKPTKIPEKVVEDDMEEPVEFFSRAKVMFPIIVADKERKQREKATHPGHKRSSASRVALSPKEAKKRRISGDSEYEGTSSPEEEEKDGALWIRRASTHSSLGSYKSSSTSARPKKDPSTPLTERCEDLQVQKDHTRNDLRSTECISLSDSDEDIKPIITPTQKARATIALVDSDEDGTCTKPSRISRDDSQDYKVDLDEEEEFPELAARARELARQKQTNKLQGKLLTNRIEGQIIGDNDPIVDIFISSIIEGSKPVMVKRKISQSLKMVRLTWCDKQLIDGQPLDPMVRSSIFLTWRNQRLFDITTCRAMGLEADDNGRLISKGDGFDIDGRIHMEAWNEELFIAHQRRIEEERRRFIEDPRSQLKTESQDGLKPELEREDRRIKLIVRARNLPDFKTIVKEATSVSQLMSAFRSFHKIEEIELALYFDGDKLEPHTTCGDTDLSDMDVVEAHVK